MAIAGAVRSQLDRRTARPPSPEDLPFAGRLSISGKTKGPSSSPQPKIPSQKGAYG